MPEGSRSAWAQYAIETPDRDALKAHLQSLGIPTVIYYVKPLHEQVAYRHYPAHAGGPAGLGSAAGTHPFPADASLPWRADQDRVIDAIRSFVSERATARRGGVASATCVAITLTLGLHGSRCSSDLSGEPQWWLSRPEQGTLVASRMPDSALKPITESPHPEEVHVLNDSRSPYDLLLEQISSRAARAGVIGLGYVGLPLAVSIARAGLPVTGFDIDPDKSSR